MSYSSPWMVLQRVLVSALRSKAELLRFGTPNNLATKGNQQENGQDKQMFSMHGKRVEVKFHAAQTTRSLALERSRRRSIADCSMEAGSRAPMKTARRVHNFGDCPTGKNCDLSNPSTFQALRLKYQIVCWDQSVNQHRGLWEESHALPKEILPIKEIALNSFYRQEG
jgi:hypothetical protein